MELRSLSTKFAALLLLFTGSAITEKWSGMQADDARLVAAIGGP